MTHYEDAAMWAVKAATIANERSAVVASLLMCWWHGCGGRIEADTVGVYWRCSQYGHLPGESKRLV